MSDGVANKGWLADGLVGLFYKACEGNQSWADASYARALDRVEQYKAELKAYELEADGEDGADAERVTALRPHVLSWNGNTRE